MKMAELSRPRGRPRSFDEGQVLSAVLDHFWLKGYAAASLDDLAAAAGVNRPSLYAAFGDKRSMYLRALKHFAGRMEEDIELVTRRTSSLKENLLAAFHASIDLYTSGPVPRGCLVLNTSVTEAPSDPAIRQVLAETIRRIDDAFEQCVSAGFESLNVSQQAARSLGLLGSAVVHSLAVRARAGEPASALYEIAAMSAEHIVGAATLASKR